MPFAHRMFLLFLYLFSSFCAYGQLNPELQRDIDRIFAQWDQPDRPGGALALIHNGAMMYQKGYGMADLENQVPIEPKSVFYIGSVSKQFVAMCMLLLEEQGKLDLDADIRTYLPDFPDYGYTITTRNLIHHTSGIRDNLTLWELIGRSHLDEIPEAEIYDLIKRQEQLNFEPGTQYSYSNSCYFMMSLILRRVTGQTLRQYAEAHIFSKLGMSHTFFNDDNRVIIPNRASGYNENAEGVIENMIMRFDLVGSGGLYSSVEDLFLWDQNFYDNQIGKRGQALIDDMLTNGRYKDGREVNYAFALVNGEYRGLPTVSHSGSLGGYRAFYIRFPEQQFSIILLGNATTFTPSEKAYAIADLYLADQMQPKPPQPMRTTSMNVAVTAEGDVAEDIDQYTGRYYAPELDFHYDLQMEAGNLILKIGEAEHYLLKPASSSFFRVENDWSIKFKKQKGEKADGFSLDAGSIKGLRFERVSE